MAQSYADMIEEFDESVPIISNLLKEAHKHRSILLKQFLVQRELGIYLSGLEELLRYLDSLYAAMDNYQELRRIAFLVSRVRGDYEASIEAVLSGYHSIVSEKMRDVMEVELLFADFAASPEHVEIWRTADQKLLRSKFSAGQLRAREAKRREIEPNKLPGAEDYKAHSHLLHVTPTENALGGPGLNAKVPSQQLAFFLAMSMWEMYFHAVRLIESSIALIGPYVNYLPEESLRELDYTAKLVKFKDAWQMANREQDSFIRNRTDEGHSLGR